MGVLVSACLSIQNHDTFVCCDCALPLPSLQCFRGVSSIWVYSGCLEDINVGDHHEQKPEPFSF